MKMASDIAQALLGPLYWLRQLVVSKGSVDTGFIMQRRTLVAIIVGSLLWGTIVYFALVLGVYQRLVRHVADEANPQSLEQLELAPSGEGAAAPVLVASSASVAALPAASSAQQPAAAEFEVASQILKNSGGPFSDRATAVMACALHMAGGVRTGAIAVAQRIPLAGSTKNPFCDTRKQCDGNARCSADVRLAAARLLVGSLGCTKQDVKALSNPSIVCHPTPFGLEPAWRPVRLARHMGCKVGDDESMCVPVTHLLQGALDDARTRSLQVQFGMVYGGGRWLVIVLALAVASTLCWRSLALRRMRLHIASLDGQLSPQRPPRPPRPQLAAAVMTELYRSEKPPEDAPNAGGDPVLALAYQAQDSHRLEDATVVKDAAKQASREMGRWWDLMGAFITLFPVIGLAATLNGLIHAFAQADQIAIALGDDRAGAIRTMVGELSSSFSTTFIALLAMAIFTLWALRLRHAEERDFDGVVERVDTYLSWRRE